MGHDADQAQDLTQGFFALLLEKQYLRDFQRQRGRFRSFLLAALKHFLANQWDRTRARKRGGGQIPMALDGERRYRLEPCDQETPERIFERHWALAVIDQVLLRLEQEAAGAGKGRQFERLRPFLTARETGGPYSRVAADLEMSEGAVKVAVHRLRGRFRELLREEISQTVADPAEIGDEIRHLLAVL